MPPKWSYFMVLLLGAWLLSERSLCYLYIVYICIPVALMLMFWFNMARWTSLYKLMGKAPDCNWLTLFYWNSHLKAIVRWEYVCSDIFSMWPEGQRGLLSPGLFNIMNIIHDDLLWSLGDAEDQVSIGSFKMSSFAYAGNIYYFDMYHNTESSNGYKHFFIICRSLEIYIWYSENKVYDQLFVFRKILVP